MKRLLLLAFFAVILVPAGSLQAATLPTTVYGGGAIAHQIHIKGIVPPMRVVYIDEQMKIVRVVGNTTDNNVVLTASHAGANTPAKMTASIYEQYQQLLADNDNHLVAGQTYYPANHNVMLPSLLKISMLQASFF